jgi:hypothetical protein
VTEYYSYDNNTYQDSDYEIGVPFGEEWKEYKDFSGQMYKEPKCEFNTKFGQDLSDEQWGF